MEAREHLAHFNDLDNSHGQGDIRGKGKWSILTLWNRDLEFMGYWL